MEGVILAGGRSTRFGGADKAVAELAGTPMVRRVADCLAGVVDALVVNGRPEQVPGLREAFAGVPRPVRYATDDVPDRGPVAGIRNGLRAVESEYAAVVACDMPFVDPDFLAYLRERADDHDAAVPRPDDWYQPTQAVYRADAMVAACDAALAGGDPRIVDPLEDLDCVVVEGDALRDHADERTFENINTREEFERAARRL